VNAGTLARRARANMFSDDDFVSTCVGKPRVRDAWMSQTRRHQRICLVLGMITGMMSLVAAAYSPVVAFSSLVSSMLCWVGAERATSDIRMMKLSAALAGSADVPAPMPTRSAG